MGPMLLQEPFSHVVNNIFVLFKFYNKDVDMITRNNLGSYCSVKFKPPISIMLYITSYNKRERRFKWAQLDGFGKPCLWTKERSD